MRDWSLIEWIAFIVFNVTINVVLQGLAFKAGESLSKRKNKEEA